MSEPSGFEAWNKDKANAPRVCYALVAKLLSLDDINGSDLHGMLGDAIEEAGSNAWTAARREALEEAARKLNTAAKIWRVAAKEGAVLEFSGRATMLESAASAILAGEDIPTPDGFEPFATAIRALK